MARLYDLFVLLDPDAPGERLQEILAGIRSAIEADGTLVGAHEWGRRRTAFEIDDRPESEYHVVQFETDSPKLLERLDHNLKITDGVLRFRIIRLKPGSGPPPQPRPDGPRHRDEARGDGRERPGGPPREAPEGPPPPAAEEAASSPAPSPAAEPAPSPEPAPVGGPAGDGEPSQGAPA